MGYIEHHLMPDEQVVYKTKLHWVVYLPTAISILAWAVALLLAISASDNTLCASFVWYLLLFASLTFIATVITYTTSEFAVTNKRVLSKVGWLRLRTRDIILTKVEGIKVSQGVLGRILGYGAIVVTGTGGTEERFERIVDPMEFRRQVQNQISVSG
jgi:membrane protein YdbS with pleckstrin-like domain